MKINRLEKTKQNKTNKQTNVMLVKNILTETEPAICHCEGVAVVRKRQFMGRCPVYRGEPSEEVVISRKAANVRR